MKRISKELFFWLKKEDFITMPNWLTVVIISTVVNFLIHLTSEFFKSIF